MTSSYPTTSRSSLTTVTPIGKYEVSLLFVVQQQMKRYQFHIIAYHCTNYPAKTLGTQLPIIRTNSTVTYSIIRTNSMIDE